MSTNSTNNKSIYSFSKKGLAIGNLILHGKEVFGSYELFFKWLNEENFFFDKKKPIKFMNTINNIKFIDDRLTGMQYGDNA